MATGKLDPTDLREQAIQYECKILHEHVCYHENGFYMEANCAETADTMEDFLRQCQKMDTDGRTKIEKQGLKFTMDKDLKAQAKTVNKHAEELFGAQQNLM